MKAKFVKIILVTAVIAFFSAGISMAQDWKGNRHSVSKAKAYSHYKKENKKHQKFHYDRHFQNHLRNKYFSKHDKCYPRRPVVIYKYRHYHHPRYRHYRSDTGLGFTLSVLDPNVAFSVGVTGR